MKKEDLLEKELQRLNIHPVSSIWAFPVQKDMDSLPSQGFKIHLSATILDCIPLLKKTASFLLENNIRFKVIKNTPLLIELNSGIRYYSQIGKFMTIYPKSSSHAFELAKKMDQLTKEFDPIVIPSDLQFSKNSNVFIRYGIIDPHRSLLRDDKGKTHKDKRDHSPIPEWVADNPFREINPPLEKHLEKKRIVITKVLRQRGKGGVYESLKLPSSPTGKSFPVILKEGRRLGEIDERGICGLSLIKNEKKALGILKNETFTPDLLDVFSTRDNYFIVMEKCKGISLSKLLQNRTSIDIKTSLSIVMKLSKILQQCHKRKFYIYDLSPDNIILGKDIHIIDWEMSVFENSGIPPKGNIGKKGFFIPAYDQNFDEEKLVDRDVFALSRIMYSLLNPPWYRDSLSSANRNAFDFLPLPKIANKKHERSFLNFFGKIDSYYPV